MSEPPPRIRALVVDDDPVVLLLLTRFLQGRGYGVEHCPDGEAALARVRAGGINLVVTDRNMPRMDGLALCRAVRALATEPYVYTIMLTASNEQQSLVAAMEAGVDDFIAKPPNLPELGARLRAAERVLSLEAGLARRNGQLADAYGQLQRDLELARTLQVGHLPAPGAFGPVRFDWRFEASGYVGGDTFDYFALGEHHLCFYLADVAGHGVAAAMMAFHAQHQLRAGAERMAQALALPHADLARTAAAVVAEYNRRFLQMGESSLFVTMLFGLLDLRSLQAALVHAGHPPALFSPVRGAPFEAIGSGGVPVGVLEEPGHEATLLQLAAGARLVLYSDGATDCRDAGGEPFGTERLRDVLASAAGAPLERTCGSVHAALRAWRGEAGFEDDVTLLALELG
ncbi:PP2C family protein-serine/threonine phosphatase [Ramlibacter alkalitolerans]|uniref:SpoIIE family protein phosphatase n=1 Tax=Ramlibacter alkalitolerans TaxID=2039631 RepID=A0ABS1JJN2_9BURK|nr:SpoIIE family protein phosphatase [Ramlibacter alkalitolerans]MBL0424391.1 SpoIIE family protein phosphatase [Ramlibacter alkalitolerans]